VRVHGMPDGIVVGRSATAAQLPPEGGAGGAGGSGGGGPGGGTAVFQQTPGEGGQQQMETVVGAETGGGPSASAPDWALAAWVVLDGNHVEWLYKRDTYVMGFMVDRLGFIDGIVVAGGYCPIAKTQLADPAHHIKLGDDSRKVMYRYGFPDEIETFVSGGGGAGGGGEQQAAGQAASGGGAPQGPGGQAQDQAQQASGQAQQAGAQPGGPGAGQGGGAPATGGATQLPGNATVTFRSVTNELRRSYLFKYHDSYNVIFTIQDNKVVRINIWGDPDYFTKDRKLQIREEKY